MRGREEGRREERENKKIIRRRRSEGGGEREEGKLRVRETTTTKFRITTLNYLPMESTTHTPKKYFSFQYNVQFLSSPYKN
jgi:hypothetical protein